MKEQLIKGKWYKAYASKNYYIKYTSFDGYYAICSEHINIKDKPQYNAWGGSCGEAKYLTEVSISEIAHLLPKNHPDLNQTIEIW